MPLLWGSSGDRRLGACRGSRALPRMRRGSRLVRGEKSASEVKGSAEVQQVRQKAEAEIILGHGWGQLRSSGTREKLGILRFAHIHISLVAYGKAGECGKYIRATCES